LLGIIYVSVSQTPGRGLVPDPSINYTGSREDLLEVVILEWLWKLQDYVRYLFLGCDTF